MPGIPNLKTGVTGQYPNSRTTSYATRVQRFLDGKEQRFPMFAAAQRRWSLKLSLLDEDEVQRIDSLFQEQAGQFGAFSFTDPWNGNVCANCSLELDEIEGTYEGPAQNSTQIQIVENR